MTPEQLSACASAWLRTDSVISFASWREAWAAGLRHGLAAQPVAVEVTDAEAFKASNLLAETGNFAYSMKRVLYDFIKQRNTRASTAPEGAVPVALGAKKMPKFTKEWCLRMGQLEAEADCEIGAGQIATPANLAGGAAGSVPAPEPAAWNGLSDAERDSLCTHGKNDSRQLCLDVEAVLKHKNPATAPPSIAAPAGACTINIFSSRACERGTKGCVTRHTTDRTVVGADMAKGPDQTMYTWFEEAAAIPESSIKALRMTEAVWRKTPVGETKPAPMRCEHPEGCVCGSMVAIYRNSCPFFR